MDRNLGSKIFPGLLREAGIKVEIHDDHFPRDESDEVWLRAVGQSSWIVLSNDKAIRYRSVETGTLMKSGVRMFVLTGNLKAEDSAEIFIKAFPKVKRFLARHNHPFIARLYKTGEIKLRFA